MEPDETDMIVNSNDLGTTIHPIDRHGLTVLTAAIFIVGEMSGTGVLSLPKSIDQSGWYGVGMVVACCLLSGYCGIRLSSCWTMIISKNQSLKYGTRDPFPVIAFEAAGNIGRILVAVICYIQLFGVAVIFLLIASHNIKSLLIHFAVQFCDWTIIIAILMCPVSMLGTPKDFWPIAVGAMLFTAVACLFILIQSLRQLPSVLPVTSNIEFKSFFVSFGTILFCFGGAVMFPTIQADMANPMQFNKSVIIAYTVMIIFYMPVAVTGYVVFGKFTQDNIIDNLDSNWLRTVILVLITGHVLTAFTIILNPMFQGFEELFKAPKTFGWKRVIIRSTIILGVLFVAQSIPNFGPILSFIGGSCVSALSFVLPCVFYILLCRQEQHQKYINKIEIVVLVSCIVIGTIGGIASTYSSIDALFDGKTFKPPCYVNRTQ